jgi:hypothetical protein
MKMLQNQFDGSARDDPAVETNRIPFKKASLVFHHLPMRNDRVFHT